MKRKPLARGDYAMTLLVRGGVVVWRARSGAGPASFCAGPRRAGKCRRAPTTAAASGDRG